MGDVRRKIVWFISLNSDGIGEPSDLLNFDRHRISWAEPARHRLGGHADALRRPVRMTVPGGSVVLPLRYSISAGTSKIMSAVVESCTRSPLSNVEIRRRFGSGISSVVTRHGPSGANVSKNFPRHH